MKKLVLLFLMIAGCCLPRLVYAQTVDYGFEYDASGNRTSRWVIQIRSAKIPKDSLSLTSPKDKESEVFREMLDNREVAIYPNPTKGLLTVEIPLSNNDLSRITLHDIQGRTLMEFKNATTTTQIDLSGQPPAIYLLRIFINNKSMTWKIIKQD